jgi:hypothetical protein
MADPYGDMTNVLGDVGERLGEYASVWRSAIERNAKSEYRADDFLVDLQTLWGMSMRDAVRVTSRVLEAWAPRAPDERDEEHPGRHA